MQDNTRSLPDAVQVEPRLPFGGDFQAILSLIGDAVVCTDQSGKIILFNRAAEVLFGYSSTEMIGVPIEVLVPTRFRDQHRDDHQRFGATAISTRRAMGAGREVMGQRKDGSELAIEVSLSRQFIDGRQIGTAVIRDVSDRRAEEKLRQLVANEVAHRLRNTMAIVNSIVSLTARAASSPLDLKTALLGRFEAISRTNESLIRGSWIEASFRELLESELAPYRSDDSNIMLDGPDMAIAPEIAVALSLVFHELGTNASKYGALSAPTGRLEVRWQVAMAERPVLEVQWRETGGPVVTPPTRRGFGSELISKSLRAHGGAANLSYPAAGVSCDISVPLR